MFTKDSRTETFLTQMGVGYRYSNKVRYDNLDPQWRQVNLARPVPIRDEAVIEYAALMEQGSAAPAPILAARDSGKMAVLDGVQRIAAAELNGFTNISAYIVTTDSDDIEAAIRVLANARLQGRAEPAEWTKRRAVEVLVVERGLTPKEVARMGGWKQPAVDRLAETIRLGKVLIAIGGPALPDAVISIVGKHLSEPRHLEKVSKPISDFLHAVKSSKLSATDAEPFVQKFFSPMRRKDRAYAEYSARLESFRNEPEVQTRMHGRKTGPLPKDAVLMRMLKGAETVAAEMADEGESVPFVDEFFRILKSINHHMKSLAPNKKSSTTKVPADMWAKDSQ